MKGPNLYTPSQEPSALQETHEPAIRESTGTSTISIRNGVPVTANSGYQSVAYAGVEQGGDWRDSARESSGKSSIRITPKTIVSIGEYGEGTVNEFLNMGILREVSLDVYEKTKSADALIQDAQDLGPQGDDAAVMPRAVAAHVDEALQPFSDPVVQTGLALGLSVAAGDMEQGALVIKLAQMSGVDPSETAERVQAVMNAGQVQADHYLGEQGIAVEDLPNFYEYARTQQKDGLKAALQSQFMGQDMSPWKALISQYMSDLPPNPEALVTAGFEVRGDQVKLDGEWIRIKAVAKAGLI